MPWRLIHKFYRYFAFLFHLAIFLIVFLAIFPVAIKSVEVERVGGIEWELNGDIVTIMAPITLKNDGFYDIKNMRMDFTVENSTAVFVKTEQNLGNIYRGEVKELYIKIPVNLTHLYELEEPNFYHFYNYDEFTVEFHTSLDYVWGMVHMKSSYINVVQWEPIVKSFDVYHPNILYQDGGRVEIVIPYRINTASYLKGDAQFYGRVYGDGFQGNFSTSITLGKPFKGNLTLNFDGVYKSILTESQVLHLDGNLKFFSFEIPLKTDYSWGAPLNGLKIEVLDNGTLHYSFRNDADFDMNLKISKDYYYQGNLVRHDESNIYVSRGEEVSRYEELNITQPVDEIIITFYDENSGMEYREVVSNENT